MVSTNISSDAVVKIFVDRGDFYDVGSGFFVSPTVICTAGHVGYCDGKKSIVFEPYCPSIGYGLVANYQVIGVKAIGKGLY